MASIAGVTGAFIAAMLEGNYNNAIEVFIDPSNSILLLIGIWIPFLMVCGAQALNDFFDFESDKANNRLDRPLVRGAYKPEVALYVGLTMLLIGVILSFIATMNIFVFSVTAFLSIVAVWYNKGIKSDGLLGPLKKTGFLGNVIVSACYTASYVLGAVVMEMKSSETQLTMLGMILATFFGALGREVIKGIMDQEGDREVGVKTPAVKYGNKVTAIMSAVFIAFAFLSALIPVFYSFHSNIVYYFGIIVIYAINFRVVYLINKHPNIETAIVCRKYTRIGMWATVTFFFLSGVTYPVFI